MRHIYSAFFLVFLIVLSFPMNAVQARSLTPKTLFVSGVEARSKDRKLNNLLIAQGMVRLIEEELFATGYFIPVENRAEIQDQVNELILSAWHSPHKESEILKRRTLEDRINSDVVVSGAITKFRKKRKKAFAGPFSKAKVTIFFGMELFLKENGKLICSGKGSGKGVTDQQAVFFQIRNDTIRFDDTSVGKAVHEAVREAVQNMVKQYETIQ